MHENVDEMELADLAAKRFGRAVTRQGCISEAYNAEEVFGLMQHNQKAPWKDRYPLISPETDDPGNPGKTICDLWEPEVGRKYARGIGKTSTEAILRCAHIAYGKWRAEQEPELGCWLWALTKGLDTTLFIGIGQKPTGFAPTEDSYAAEAPGNFAFKATHALLDLYGIPYPKFPEVVRLPDWPLIFKRKGE